MAQREKRYWTRTSFGLEWLVAAYVAYNFAYARPVSRPAGLDPWLGYPLLFLAAFCFYRAAKSFMTKPYSIGISDFGVSLRSARQITIYNWGVVRAVWDPDQMAEPGVYLQFAPGELTPDQVRAGVKTGATMLLPAVSGVSDRELALELRTAQSESAR